MIRWCLVLAFQVSALELRHNSTGPLPPLPVSIRDDNEPEKNILTLLVPKHFTIMDPSAREVKDIVAIKDELLRFFQSARIASFVSFLLFFTFLMAASLLLHHRESKFWWQHIFSLSFWILMTFVYAGVTLASEGTDKMSQFARGYFIELVLSLENVFVYEMILVSFRVPHRVAKDMLYALSFFQMFFQLWLFMFVAKLFQSIQSLPYLMGAWLLYIGIDSLRESHDDTTFDPETSSIYRLLTWALGDRLAPHYGGGSLVISDGKDGKWQLTMMAPVTFSLVLIMYWLELDVTLAKIEDLPSHFIGWTSSVFVAFQLPDLYFIVSEMFKLFSLLRPGISLLLIFFGCVLLLRTEVTISDNVEIICMLSIVVVSMILSRCLGLPQKKGQAYDSSDQESEQETVDEKGAPSPMGYAAALMHPHE